MAICVYYRSCPEGNYNACSDNDFNSECPFAQEDYRRRHGLEILTEEQKEIMRRNPDDTSDN
jgi:hypothetical protein